MQIESFHVEQCLSTQSYLKKLLVDKETSSENVLVSSINQTNGVGRRGSKWVQLEKSLAFSCIVSMHKVKTLTTLEMAVLVSDFFDNKILLKWPNDLYSINYEKIGGMIGHIYNDSLILGVGINLDITKDEREKIDAPYKIGSLKYKKIEENFKKELPKKLYNFLLSNRIINSEEVISRWTNKCFHIDKKCELKDDESQSIIIKAGKFSGIGKNGGAIIDGSKFFSGSLKIY